MDAVRKAEWTAALRSGEYEQGSAALTRYVAYDRQGNEVAWDSPYRVGDVVRLDCCLGVESDLCVKSGAVEGLEFVGPGRGELASPDFGTYVWRDGNDPLDAPYRETSTLPHPVRDWAGLESNNPAVPVSDIEPEISALPDDRQARFRELTRERDTITLAELNDAGFTFAQIADVIDRCL